MSAAEAPLPLPASPHVLLEMHGPGADACMQPGVPSYLEVTRRDQMNELCVLNSKYK